MLIRCGKSFLVQPCDGGLLTQKRFVHAQAQAGGTPCPPLEDLARQVRAASWDAEVTDRSHSTLSRGE